MFVEPTKGPSAVLAAREKLLLNRKHNKTMKSRISCKNQNPGGIPEVSRARKMENWESRGLFPVGIL